MYYVTTANVTPFPKGNTSWQSMLISKSLSNHLYALGTLEKHRNSFHTCVIRHCNPSVRIIVMVSYATYVLCVNFIHKWRDLQFKVDSKRHIFLRNFSWQFYLFSEVLPEICREEIVKVILFVFYFDVWPGVRTLALRLISQHTTR